MQRAASNLLLATVAVIAGALGVFAQQHLVRGGIGGEGIVGDSRVDFSLPDIDGKPRQLSEFDGKVLVVNFWATWCAPCRKEIPDFVRLQAHYGKDGVQFIGVAMDRPDNVKEFVKETPITYPVLVGDEEGRVTQEYGNEMVVLPYTVVINRGGKITAVRRGLFAPDDLEAALRANL